MAEDEEQARGAVEDVSAEAAADIICSLRGADLAGWTPPWKGSGEVPAAKEEEEEEIVSWPAVARGKRSRSRRRSPSGSGSAAKGRWARGSPASPLDYSVGSRSGSGASTSGGEDGAFCSPPAPVADPRTAAVVTPALPPSTKVVAGSAGGRRPSTIILPVPPPRPAGQRSRKKMRLPEVQQLVRSLTAENAALREEMASLRGACTALSMENGELETRISEHSSDNPKGAGDERERPRKAKLGHRGAADDWNGGFVLPDLNVPAEDVDADGPAATAP